MQPRFATAALILIAFGLAGCGDGDAAAKLRKAAGEGDTAACARLVAAGVPVDAADGRGLTPLGYAVYRQRAEAVRWLLDAGADVRHSDALGNTPLMYTARAPFGRGSYRASTRGARNEIARLLLARGADAGRANAGGTAPLHAAAMDQNPELILLLLSAGADPSARTEQGYSVVDIAAFPVYAPNARVLATLRATTRPAAAAPTSLPPQRAGDAGG